MEPQAKLVIGDRVSLNYRGVVSVARRVKIGDDTLIALPGVARPAPGPRARYGCRGVAGNHRKERLDQHPLYRHAWATIDDNSVVVADSVVTKPLPPGTLVAGNPTRVIRPLVDY